MNPFESGAVIDMSVGHNSATPAPIGADALRVAAQAALTALENLHEIDTETECITIDVRDEIDALRAALASTAQQDYAELERVTDDLAALVRQLVRSLRKAAPQHALPDKALDYLKRKGLQGSPLRHNA